jgi:hypothetical protein
MDQPVAIKGLRMVENSMFYHPAHAATGKMWDTWLYFHEGKYYLYYLAMTGDQFDNISMATSSDGVNWEEMGPILQKSDEVTWMGTGSIWKSPISPGEGRYQMNYSEWTGPRQTIFFADSNDLIHWRRLGKRHEFVQDDRWYAPLGRWDCIWTIPRPGGGVYGYWTATPKPETAGRFGFGQSLDGVRWEALPPPRVDGVGEGEVGAIEKIGDRYFMMFGSGGRMVTLKSEKAGGPFQAAVKNQVLLGGHTYFSRFFPTPDGLLANHHSIARDGQVYMGLLKQALVDQEGVLRLYWWKGNDRLKSQRTGAKIRIPDISTETALMLENKFDILKGLVLEGSIQLPPTVYTARRGFYIEYEPDHGMAVLFDNQGRAEIHLVNESGAISKLELTVDRELSYQNPAQFRLVLQHSLAEFYLDHVLIECFSLPTLATGRIGLIRGENPHSISNLFAWN